MIDGEVRDRLAVQRTQLANERTLLAYIRTALASAASGAALLQFFPELDEWSWAAWLLIISGIALLLIGLYRYFAIREQLRNESADPE